MNRKLRVLGRGACVVAVTVAMVIPVSSAHATKLGDVAQIPRAAQVSSEEADAIIDEFNRTGLVEGSEAPTVRNNFENEAPDEVFELADALYESYGQTEGYGPVEWDREAQTVRVWWHGDVPADVIEEAERLSSVTRLATTVEVMTYSSQDLAVAANQILDANADTVESVTALYDGSGLEVAVSSATKSRVGDPTRSDELGADEAFPVSIVESGEVAPANDRQSGQVTPYAGGARIYAAYVNAGCTSAFGVMITQPALDRDKPRGMITAHHCGNYGPGNWGTPGGYFYGYKTSEYASPHRDAAVMVNSPGQSGVSDSYPLYYPMMYVGAWNAGSRYIVVNGQTPVVGADWCVSGSYSGTFCYNEITQTNVYVNYGGPTNVGPLVETVNYNNLYPVGQGDSGGPAYRYVSATGNGVFATGIISGIRNAGTTCSGYQYTGRLCSNTALISAIYPAMTAMGGGLTLMTNTNY
ncbi:S1 family peptidase [Microbacterium sp. F2E]|uniref:S1 family peptidase n=1 Tax=Microbacterium sp. F2E TaxID=2895284 RepID=UPI001E36DD9D|nr:S1 family peptidase [Microbacterium sp. F2E]MCC9053523.1 S1 family peptidase [Microbacterium sp. F2E]